MSRSLSIRAMYVMAQRPGGVSSSEAVAETGMPITQLSTRLGWMAATGRVRRERVQEGRVTSRYFADPSKSLDQVEAALARKRKVRADKGKPKPSKALTIKAPKPVAQPAAVLHGNVIVPAGLKVTKCPISHDTRFTPAGTERLFSLMAPGSYLPGDSWAARAFG